MRDKILEILRTRLILHEFGGVGGLNEVADEIMELFTFVRIGDDDHAYMYSQEWIDEMRRNQGNLPLDEGHG